jgi:hypothetical protein
MTKLNFMKTSIWLLLLFLLANAQSNAQPFNLTESVQPIELNFTEHKKEGEEKANGRISINTFNQEQDTAYYFIKGLSLYSPTYFSVNSSDPGTDIKVNLCKENWHSFHQSGAVQGKEIWSSRFKTEGDFGIMVIANKKPAKYVLLVWTGNEMTIAMPSVFKSAAEGTAGGEGWFAKNKTMVIVIAVALAIISVLLLKLKKKRQ